jgi:opacity protein-like surface antigen
MKRFWIPLASALLLLICVAPAQAQLTYGAQVSIADEVDLGIVARVGMGLDKYLDKLQGTATFDFYFPGDNQTFWTVNVNALYPIPLEGTGKLTPYAGAGLGLAHYAYDMGISGDYDETKFNLNVIVGTTFEAKGSLTPFLELRLPLGGFEGIGFFLSGGVWF